ncbi:MAG: nucleotide exchange factor GrpE [Gammaproteobacteria bacterium]|nr:nucleotide exchange factor GrpE [Gammaproteobacteria bacterium]
MNQQSEPQKNQSVDEPEAKPETERDSGKESVSQDQSDHVESDAVEETETGDSCESGLEGVSREEIIERLNEKSSEIDEMKDGYIRAKAEVENVRRRSQNEIISARKYAIEGFALELLSVIDSLDQASKVEMDESSGEAVVKMKEGLELTRKQLGSVMGKFGVSEVEAAPGVKFDPEIHQAISMVESQEIEAEHILDVMQTGFTLKDRLLRPAMVVIAKSTDN